MCNNAGVRIREPKDDASQTSYKIVAPSSYDSKGKGKAIIFFNDEATPLRRKKNKVCLPQE